MRRRSSQATSEQATSPACLALLPFLAICIAAFLVGTLVSAAVHRAPLSISSVLRLLPDPMLDIDAGAQMGYGHLSTETVDMAVDNVNQFQGWFELSPYAQGGKGYQRIR